MDKVQAFIPLALMWLALGGMQVVCTLSINAYRTKKMPPFDSVGMAAGSGILIWMASQQADYPVLAGFLLFFSGFAVFCGMTASMGALRATKNPVTA